MSMCMVLRQSVSLRQELRLETKQSLEAPAPESATRGFAGLRSAHGILLERGLPGLLGGGLARKAWISPSRSSLSPRKDVDVAVLHRKPDAFPERFEGGIDWWLPDGEGLLTNGNGVELIYTVSGSPSLRPGLYLPQPDVLWIWRTAEYRAFGGKRLIRDAKPRLRCRPLIHEYPICPSSLLCAGFAPRERWQVL